MKKTFAPMMVALVAVIFISYVPAVAAKPMVIGSPAHASKLREGDEHAFPSSASKAPRPAEAPPTRRLDLPFAAQAAIAGVLGRDDTAYAVVSTPNGYRDDNPAHDLTAEFTAAGVHLRHSDADWSLQLLSVTAGNAENPVAPAEPRVSANRVEYG